jgi:hypothetical protein
VCREDKKADDDKDDDDKKALDQKADILGTVFLSIEKPSSIYREAVF